MSGVTLRGAVRLKTGVAEFGFSRDDEGNGVLSWASVPAGRWSYDVFMDDGNEERPLLYGCFVSAGRVTPDLPDEQQAVAGAVVVQLPEGSGCVQVMLDNASSAAWYAEQAKKYATNAGNSEVSAANSAAAAAASDAASSSASASTSAHNAAASESSAESYAAAASKSVSDAATSATSAANSATAAANALAAMPQVDASGNMTLAGGLTAAGAINANGGVNIPLAVGAPTDTSAVNRLHAAGLAGVTDIFSQHAYLNTGSITATGTAATTAFIPGQYAQVRVPAGTHSTIVFPFTGPNGQHNYSNFAGFSIPWRILGAGKITIGIGRGSKTTRSDLTLDSYSVIPGNNLAHNSGEILDITFDNIRDTQRNGYTVRVREIYALTAADGWKVKTTTSFIPASHNEPIPSIVNKIIYHQRTQYKFESEYISYGSLYLLTGGGQTVQLHKIAAVRGVNAFETGVGISSIVTDLPGNASGDVYMQVGSAVRTLYQPGNINPVYYALEALARNDIEAEETADFVDINIPL